MLIGNLDKYMSMCGRIDAIMIVNRENIIEYSAMVTADKECLRTDNILGKNLFDVYPNLDENTSTHARVLRTGLPIVNERQTVEEQSGRSYQLVTSTFPIENNGQIIGTIDLSAELSLEEAGPQSKKENALYTISDIITQNAEMKSIKDKISRIAKNDSPVMVIGESGTGKELVVESIHSMSRRKGKPFLSLNCAAVPETLIESLLFGTVKGSFTGAENKKGLFELADKGTLFLDEINSMNLEMQTKLLKVVEEQRYMKVGGEQYIHVDVRLISAMNENPKTLLASGRLRQDLFYRLGVIQISLPPLRERKEDLSVLSEHYIRFFNQKMKRNIRGIDEPAWKILMEYQWPGNVREFRNTMEYAFNIADGDQICISDLPDYLISDQIILKTTKVDSCQGGLAERVDRYEAEIITETLRNNESLNETARQLKLTRQALKYKIDKYGIDYRNLLGGRENI